MPRPEDLTGPPVSSDTSPKTMHKKAVVLLSGGLDSTLALCLMKEQGVALEALYVRTMFGCCKEDARQVAYRHQVPFTMLHADDDYLEVIRKPKYGYGRGVNPCVDCRIYMFHMAKRFMEKTGASFLVTGEVLDQRPMSQKMKDFRHIEADTGLEGKILRPLSAKRLPLTLPEKEGLVNREKLLGVQGRSRLKFLELASCFGLEETPSPSSGCALTSPDFGKKVRDVFKHSPRYERWEFEVLKIGRHFRLGPQAKVVVARNHNQNEYFEALRPRGTTLLTCRNFGGPHALYIGAEEKNLFEQAGALMLRYAQKPLPEKCEISWKNSNEEGVFELSAPASESFLENVRIV